MGSPMGATFCNMILVWGISPISSKRQRREPSPPTAEMVALWPIFRSLSVMRTSELDISNQILTHGPEKCKNFA